MSTTIQKSKKRFNTAGRCFPTDHYMIEPLSRMTRVEEYIEEKLYFTIHAPRQTGKTTYLHTLAQKLNAEGGYIALVVSFERAGVPNMSVENANQIIMNAIYQSSSSQLQETERPKNPAESHFPDLYNYLRNWSENQEKPITLFVDEIDALLDEVLISILRQLRDGYQDRPNSFPSSVVLIGLRDVRDYKVKVREDIKSYGTASPFNIKSASLLLKNFTQSEVFELLEQHTQETGQVFPDEVKTEIFRLSKGQPWLVNALARQMVSEILRNDTTQKITYDILLEAKNQLILRRDTHLDSLSEKLKEKRVLGIVQAIINGDNLPFDIYNDDVVYVRDLGIVGMAEPLEFANPIYAEIIPRIMAAPIQSSIPKEIQPQFFIEQNGQLNMEKLLKAFQKFYRKNSESWLHRFEYRESAQQLLLMAFLQRVVNSGGEVTREMAVGNGRLDILVSHKGQQFALELKIKRDKDTIEDGKEQLSGYLDKLGLKEGYLIIFDIAPGEWEEKIYYQETTYMDKTLYMVGL